MTKNYTLEDIGKECGVKAGTILEFIKYKIEKGDEMPAPIPYQRQVYVYTEMDALFIINEFKNKKYGEMAEYSYKRNYGKKFREKYPNPKRRFLQDNREDK